MVSGANSTSITGPMTRTTRPVPPSCVGDFSSAVAVIGHFPSLSVSLGEGFSATHDLHDFLGDLRLSRGVCVPGEGLDQLVSVVAGGLHCTLPSCLLRCG